MRPHVIALSSVATGLVCLGLFRTLVPDASSQPKVTTKAEVNSMIHGQPACFVPNVGQWDHRAKFVQRGGERGDDQRHRGARQAERRARAVPLSAGGWIISAYAATVAKLPILATAM